MAPLHVLPRIPEMLPFSLAEHSHNPQRATQEPSTKPPSALMLLAGDSPRMATVYFIPEHHATAPPFPARAPPSASLASEHSASQGLPVVADQDGALLSEEEDPAAGCPEDVPLSFADYTEYHSYTLVNDLDEESRHPEGDPLVVERGGQDHPLVKRKLLELLVYLQRGADFHPIEIVQDICDLLHINFEEELPAQRVFTTSKASGGGCDVCLQVDPTELDSALYGGPGLEEGEEDDDDDGDDDMPTGSDLAFLGPASGPAAVSERELLGLGALAASRGAVSPSAGYWRMSSAHSSAERAVQGLELNATAVAEQVQSLESVCASIECAVERMSSAGGGRLRRPRQGESRAVLELSLPMSRARILMRLFLYFHYLFKGFDFEVVM